MLKSIDFWYIHSQFSSGKEGERFPLCESIESRRSKAEKKQGRAPGSRQQDEPVSASAFVMGRISLSKEVGAEVISEQSYKLQGMRIKASHLASLCVVPQELEINTRR